MLKEFNIGENRRVIVKKVNGEFVVIIEEQGSEMKRVTLPPKRWAAFLLYESQIDQNLSCLAAKQNVRFFTHIGGAYYISITSGYECIDIREFYYKLDKGINPTKHGIALRIREWAKLKQVILAINQKYPTLATAEPCAYQMDHNQLEIQQACLECNPFSFQQTLNTPPFE
jgi:hypothetical protein